MNTAAALGNSTVLSPKKETHCQFIYFSSFDDFSSLQRFFHDVGMGTHIQYFTFLCMHDCCLMRKHVLSQALFFYDNTHYTYFIKNFPTKWLLENIILCYCEHCIISRPAQQPDVSEIAFCLYINLIASKDYNHMIFID